VTVGADVAVIILVLGAVELGEIVRETWQRDTRSELADPPLDDRVT